MESKRENVIYRRTFGSRLNSHHVMNDVSKSKRHPEKCVYCGHNPGITDDHVPRKSFFPQPRPSNLITVPACNKCNSSIGKDEDYFLAAFMFSEAERWTLKSPMELPRFRGQVSAWVSSGFVGGQWGAPGRVIFLRHDFFRN